MLTLIQDPDVSQELIDERRSQGLDRWDEVWNGVYIVMTQPSDEHQNIVAGLTAVLYQLIQRPGLGQVRPGVNVSDRPADWKENFRCPDVVVYLDGNPAENRGAFWLGGPDLAVEVISPGDRTREKLDFYASVHTRELLIVDRDPWSLELFRLAHDELQPIARSTPDSKVQLELESVPLSFQLIAGSDRPHIRVVHQRNGDEWIL